MRIPPGIVRGVWGLGFGGRHPPSTAAPSFPAPSLPPEPARSSLSSSRLGLRPRHQSHTPTSTVAAPAAPAMMPPVLPPPLAAGVGAGAGRGGGVVVTPVALLPPKGRDTPATVRADTYPGAVGRDSAQNLLLPAQPLAPRARAESSGLDAKRVGPAVVHYRMLVGGIPRAYYRRKFQPAPFMGGVGLQGLLLPRRRTCPQTRARG